MVMNLRKLMLLNLLHYLDTFRSLDTDIEAQLGKLLCPSFGWAFCCFFVLPRYLRFLRTSTYIQKKIYHPRNTN